MTIPTRAKLVSAFGEDVGARLYQALKRPAEQVADLTPSVAAWLQRCHHEPSTHERKMRACDEILNGSGVEAVFGDDSVYWPRYSYINMGDPYVTTLIMWHDGEREPSRVTIGTWGDIEETDPTASE